MRLCQIVLALWRRVWISNLKILHFTQGLADLIWHYGCRFLKQSCVFVSVLPWLGDPPLGLNWHCSDWEWNEHRINNTLQYEAIPRNTEYGKIVGKPFLKWMEKENISYLVVCNPLQYWISNTWTLKTIFKPSQAPLFKYGGSWKHVTALTGQKSLRQWET